METKYKTAHSTISWARGCSRQEARRLCSEVQDLQEEESSHSEIADAILWLQCRGGPYTVNEIARKAEEMPFQEGEKRVETIAEDPDVLRFEGTLAHQEFLDWIDRHAHNGFVLNVRGEGRNLILHTARCPALRPDPKEGNKMTARPKLCATDLSALRRKGTNFSNRIEHCPQCDI